MKLKHNMVSGHRAQQKYEFECSTMMIYELHVQKINLNALWNYSIIQYVANHAFH